MTGRRRSSRLPRRSGIHGLLPSGSVTLGSTDLGRVEPII
jgi:hypothetical protein